MEKRQGRVRDISERLSVTFQRLIPLPAPSAAKGRRPTKAEVASTSTAALTQFYEAAYKERIRHNLGIVARARVAILLQSHLLNAGYPRPLVKQVLFAMLTSAFVG